MARCANCGKLMLFGSRNGYCSACAAKLTAKQPLEAETPRPAAPAAPAAKGPGPIREDGIYCLARKNNTGAVAYFMCLRFYPRDRKVIAGSFSSLPTKRFFSREQGSYKLNPYTLLGSVISFGAVSERGVVDYSGTIDGNKTVVDTLSHINGHAAKGQVFMFLTDELVEALRKKGY